MKVFRYGIAKKSEVLEELERNGYKLYEYDLYYNYYTYVVNWSEEHLTTRTYIFDENDILIRVKTK